MPEVKDLFGETVFVQEYAITAEEKRKIRGKRNAMKRGYAAPPGSGPEGETCKSCAHCYGTSPNGGKRFYKCDLIKPTRSARTDVKLKSPACSRWTPEAVDKSGGT